MILAITTQFGGDSSSAGLPVRCFAKTGRCNRLRLFFREDLPTRRFTQSYGPLNSLALLQEELYTSVCGLSYTGDVRMRFAEDRGKVRKIVLGSLPRFVDLYEEPVRRLQMAGVPVDSPGAAADGLWRQVKHFVAFALRGFVSIR